jgi:hypothetical protein
MSLFNFLKKKERGNSKRNNKPKDERKAECPYCDGVLNKVPGAKTKCPCCKKFIFVRTRPQDEVRVVVTAEGADKIDEEWRIINGTQEMFLENQRRFNERRELLKEKLGGKNPKKENVQWSLLNESLMEHLKNGEMGLYRNVKLDMAQILKKEGKLKEALKAYLGICYLDLNGPINDVVKDEQGNIIEINLFNPDFGDLAPGIIKEIKRIVEQEGLEKNKVKEIYFEFNSKIKKSTKAPLDLDDCFKKTEKEIFQKD